MIPIELPPRPPKGTGIPEAAWLDPAGGKHLHHYAPGANTAACRRYRSVPDTRAAWLRRETTDKPKCLACLRMTSLGWFPDLMS
jgi:hypothetical protein